MFASEISFSEHNLQQIIAQLSKHNIGSKWNHLGQQLNSFYLWWSALETVSSCWLLRDSFSFSSPVSFSCISWWRFSWSLICSCISSILVWSVLSKASFSWNGDEKLVFRDVTHTKLIVTTLAFSTHQLHGLKFLFNVVQFVAEITKESWVPMEWLSECEQNASKTFFVWPVTPCDGAPLGHNKKFRAFSVSQVQWRSLLAGIPDHNQ